MAEFENVGKLSEFAPGTTKMRTINGEMVAVVNLEGKLHAFTSYCTHVGYIMTGSDIYNGEVVCPLHWSVFDLETGKVVDGPAFDPLTIYDVRVAGEDVLIGKE